MAKVTNTEVVKTTGKTYDSGTYLSQNWVEQTPAGANTFAVEDNTLSSAIKVLGTGDVIYVEGNFAEYQWKQNGKTVTFDNGPGNIGHQKIAVTMNSMTNKVQVSTTIIFLDGSVTLTNKAGGTKVSINGLDDNDKSKSQLLTTKFAEVVINAEDNNTAADYFTGPVDPVNDVTFDLTINVDTFVGTVGNDTFNAQPAVAGLDSQASTLNPFDSIDGGAGIDTMNIYTSASGIYYNEWQQTGNHAQQGTITNVETINIFNATDYSIFNYNNDTSLGGAYIDASKFVGATTINQTKFAAGIDNLSSSTTAGYNQITSAQTFEIAAAVTAASSTLKFGGVAEGSTVSVAGGATGVLNAVNISGTVTDTNKDGKISDTFVNVTVGKDIQSLSLNTSVGSILTVSNGAGTKPVTTVDASASTGNITYIAGNSVGTIKTGSGTDAVTAQGSSVKTISVSAGNDTVTTHGNAALDDITAQKLEDSNVAYDALAIAQATAATALAASATAAALVVTDTATLATDTAAATVAQTAVTNLTAQVAADTTVNNAAVTTVANAQAILNAATVVEGNALSASQAADALVVTDTATLATDTAAAATALAASNAAAALVVTDTQVEADLVTLNTAVTAAADQTECDAASAAALAAGAITAAERSTINSTFAVGLLTNLATAQAQASAVVGTYQTTAAAVTVADTTAAATALAASQAADALVVSDTATLATDTAAAATALAAYQSAAAVVVTDTAALANAQTVQTATQATLDSDTAALNAATTALNAANALVAADTATLATDTAAAATALAASNAAAAEVVTDTAAYITANNDYLEALAISDAAGSLTKDAVINLGTGDDTLTLGNSFAAGATLTGDVGVDTLEMSSASYGIISNYTSAQLSTVTGFEVLNIDTALTAGTYDQSLISGITSFIAGQGVTSNQTAVLNNIAATNSITLTGDLATNEGTLDLRFKTDTANDVLNIALAATYLGANDTVVNVFNFSETIIAEKTETININSTGVNTLDAVLVDGYKADEVENLLTLTDNALVTLNITGDAKLDFTAGVNQIKLSTINASTNTGGLNFYGGSVSPTDSVAMTITGSATAGNEITASVNADTITGGAGNDVIFGLAGKDTITTGAGNDIVNGGAAADNITLGAGNDTYVLGGTLGSDSTVANKDIVTDFSANTYGNGISGAAGTGATDIAAKLNGDVIDLTKYVDDYDMTGVSVGVVSSAGNALAFLQLNATNTNFVIGAALDSTTGDLYIDLDGNGVADSVIGLTGVTTITAAAFDITPAIL